LAAQKLPPHGYKYAKPLSPSKGSDPAPVDFSGWLEAYLGGAWQTIRRHQNRLRQCRFDIITKEIA